MVTYVDEALNDVSDSYEICCMTAQRSVRVGKYIQPTFTLEAIRELQDSGVTAHLPPIVLEILRVVRADASNLPPHLNRLRALKMRRLPI